MKRIRYLYLIGLLLILSSCMNNNTSISFSEEKTKSTILVEIKGKVQFPGIYEVESDIYLYELIDLAGGLLDTADTTNLNLVMIISNSCSINISGIDEKESASLVNINYATIEQLQTLPGIGEAIALKIVSYRETNGLFSKIEDIMKVNGIKENLFNKIKDKITV